MFGNYNNGMQTQLMFQSDEKRKNSGCYKNIVAGKPLCLVSFVLIVGLLITCLNLLQLRAMQQEHFQLSHGAGSHPEGETDTGAKRKPIFWVKAKHPDSGYLDHVYRVLERLGFVRGTSSSDWDLLWSHDYPFLEDNMKPILRELKPHQKVNHIPGSGFYTSKVNLATSNITGIPPAFGLPEDRSKFVKFAEKHAEKLWVQKSNKHRGVKILKLSELDLAAQNSFIQEYIANPLLIDGRKFDIGIYTVVTSALPLRVYIMESDCLLRFCPEEYHPFDATNVDKYVVGDDYKPTWEMPSLKNYYETLGFTFRESLNAYLEKSGKDPQKLWRQIRETIRQVYLAKAKEIQPLMANYKHAWNFFELSRFDFVVDEDLNVYLMEANMSPNLSSGHFARNKELYEKVVYNLFSLVGVGRRVVSTSLQELSADASQMCVSTRDVRVWPTVCATDECHTCGSLLCQLCSNCMNIDHETMLTHAASEHLNRHGMRRIIPEPIAEKLIESKNSADFESFVSAIPFTLSPEDVQMRWWFYGKCLLDRTWCS